jgi:hypothetical protein
MREFMWKGVKRCDVDQAVWPARYVHVEDPKLLYNQSADA